MFAFNSIASNIICARIYVFYLQTLDLIDKNTNITGQLMILVFMGKTGCYDLFKKTKKKF